MLLWVEEQGCYFQHSDESFRETFSSTWKTDESFILRFHYEILNLGIIAIDNGSIKIVLEFWKGGELIKVGSFSPVDSLLPNYTLYSSNNCSRLIEEFTSIMVTLNKEFLVSILGPLSEGRTPQSR